MRASDLEKVSHILDGLEAVDQAESMMARQAGDSEVAGVALDALQARLSAIGEAVSSLSADLRDDRPAVPWAELARLGELIGDDDGTLDPSTVSAAIAEPVRALRAACRSILGESVRAGEDEP